MFGAVGERKVEAAYKFFIYTLVGSIFMLISLSYLLYVFGSLSYFVLESFCRTLPFYIQVWIWFSIFFCFAVKLPMVPVHLWLPEAHVEAPTAGSVLLAGILLKMGGYGIMRYLLPLFPAASVYFTPLVYVISLISIFYASLTTIRQIDLKKIIAYSSVAHMSYVTLGLFSNTIQGIEGALLLMLSHGLISSGLFLLVGMIYERYKSRIIFYYGGLVQVMPICSAIFFLFIMGNISFPGTSAFISELLVLVGLYFSNTLVCVLGAIGTIIGALIACGFIIVYFLGLLIILLIRTEI